MATFNFDTLENASSELKKLTVDIEKFNDDFMRLANGLNIDTKALNIKQSDYIRNSDDIMSNRDPDVSQDEAIKEFLLNNFTDINNLLANMNLSEYKELNKFNESLNESVKNKIETYKQYGLYNRMDDPDSTNAIDNSNLPSVSLNQQMVYEIIKSELNNFANFTGNLPLSYAQGVLNPRTAMMLFFWGMSLTESSVLQGLNESYKNAIEQVFGELVYVNKGNKIFYDPIEYLQRPELYGSDIFYETISPPDGLKGNSKNETIAELQETLTVINNNINNGTANIKKDFNFAYENKYHISIKLPYNTSNVKTSNILIDNTHFISSSIPSFSVDVLENKLNNLKRKSGGNIVGDSFSITFRDNADRDYYTYFQAWISKMYNTKDWDSNIRLYNYPKSYFGEISFFMLHSGGGNNQIKASSTPIKPTVYDYREKVRWNTEYLSDSDKNSIMQSQLNQIPYITGKITSTHDIKSWINNYYINNVISFYNIFPSQISDVQLNSGSGELSTFDVSFEYTFPVKFWKWNGYTWVNTFSI